MSDLRKLAEYLDGGRLYLSDPEMIDSFKNWAARSREADNEIASLRAQLEQQRYENVKIYDDARKQLADFQRTAWLILRSCTFDGRYVAVERSTVAEFDPGKSILESWTDAKDGTYCFRARVALTDENGK